MDSSVSELNYNAWYGSATKELIRSIGNELERGNTDHVLKVLRGLEEQYRPTYENRANYVALVDAATERMEGVVAIESGSAWDVGPVGKRTWIGHWEGTDSSWVCIYNNFVDNSMDRGGNIVDFTMRTKSFSGRELYSQSVSPDLKTVTFEEEDLFLHTLVLTDKGVAVHEILDLEKEEVVSRNRIQKLIQSAREGKTYTEGQSIPEGN